MKSPLNIVIDVSGSMAEGGKRLIARGVAREAEQYYSLGYGCADLRLIVWSKEARVVEWLPSNEFSAEILVCEGAANVQVLIDLLGEQPDGKVLLISDGFWSQVDAKAFKRWKGCLPPETLRIIKIGADANPQLKGADVYAAEDVLAALDCWPEAGVV